MNARPALLVAVGLLVGGGCSGDVTESAPVSVSVADATDDASDRTVPAATESVPDATESSSTVATTITPTTVSAPPTTGESASGTSTPPAVVPFFDSFDDDRSGWGGQFQTFDDGRYVWSLPSGQSDARAPDALIAVEDEVENVTVTTSFEADGMLAVGIDCAYEDVGASARWYRLELGTDGARIRKQPLGDDPVETLANNPDVTLTDEPTTIAATCVLDDANVYQLTFTVNGAVAVSAADVEPFGRAGAPNLTAGAAPDSAETPEHTVRFDEFSVVPAAS